MISLIFCIILFLGPNVCKAEAFDNFEIPRFDAIADLKERIDEHSSASYLVLPHIYRAFIHAGAVENNTHNYTASESCQKSLTQYYHALQRKETWAWKMYDATGKQSSGIFWGATTWTGNYEECLNIMVDQCKMYQGGACSHLSQPATHFCSIHMKNAPWMPKLISSINLPFPVPPSPFIVDACLPVNCTSTDIHSIVDAWFVRSLESLEKVLNLEK